MSRIDTSRWHTRPKHEATAVILTRMIANLRLCFDENTPIDAATRRQALAYIEAARRDVERCTTSLSDMIRYQELADPRMSDHAGIIHTLNQLSIKLKTNEPYTVLDLDTLSRQIISEALKTAWEEDSEVTA